MPKGITNAKGKAQGDKALKDSTSLTLKELKKTTKLLKEIREILDNTWRGRMPQ